MQNQFASKEGIEVRDGPEGGSKGRGCRSARRGRQTRAEQHPRGETVENSEATAASEQKDPIEDRLGKAKFTQSSSRTAGDEQEPRPRTT